MNLLISTLNQGHPLTSEVQQQLESLGLASTVIETDGMKISHCIGCNDCWIKTPGICCIKDDYFLILLQILEADRVIFLAEAKLGFVSSRMKNCIDRLLPLATMHLTIEKGQMRHYSRYGKMPDLALLYCGNADSEFMNLWLSRVQLNLHGRSLGAYSNEHREELYHALTCH